MQCSSAFNCEQLRDPSFQPRSNFFTVEGIKSYQRLPLISTFASIAFNLILEILLESWEIIAQHKLLYRSYREPSKTPRWCKCINHISNDLFLRNARVRSQTFHLFIQSFINSRECFRNFLEIIIRKFYWRLQCCIRNKLGYNISYGRINLFHKKTI